MNLIGSLFKSSIGRKILVALTGLVMFGFVTGHLLGNLQVFGPPELINVYAHKLEALGPILWIVRSFLLVALVIHVWLTIQLTIENRAARPQKYAVNHTNRATLASRVMAISGLIVLAFVIFHLLHYTVRVNHPEWNEHTYTLADGITKVRDVHTMIVQGFSSPLVSIFYIFAVGLLSYHLSHGIESSVHTLGLKNESWAKNIRVFAIGYCWLYFLANAAMPIAVLAGFLTVKA
ncbi:succinate dehydrogenase cytochrome b subunit [Oleiharenicola lentus]|uniref:succinate dehydrogenase cytochrome b subunit n=1 Tax=Oleiharenicola lentus TaxID=2508720 RepID=UPI003F6724D7